MVEHLTLLEVIYDFKRARASTSLLDIRIDIDVGIMVDVNVPCPSTVVCFRFDQERSLTQLSLSTEKDEPDSAEPRKQRIAGGRNPVRKAGTAQELPESSTGEMVHLDVVHIRFSTRNDSWSWS